MQLYGFGDNVHGWCVYSLLGKRMSHCPDYPVYAMQVLPRLLVMEDQLPMLSDTGPVRVDLESPHTGYPRLSLVCCPSVSECRCVHLPLGVECLGWWVPLDYELSIVPAVVSVALDE